MCLRLSFCTSPCSRLRNWCNNSEMNVPCFRRATLVVAHLEPDEGMVSINLYGVLRNVTIAYTPPMMARRPTAVKMVSIGPKTMPKKTVCRFCNTSLTR